MSSIESLRVLLAHLVLVTGLELLERVAAGRPKSKQHGSSIVRTSDIRTG